MTRVMHSSDIACKTKQANALSDLREYRNNSQPKNHMVTKKKAKKNADFKKVKLKVGKKLKKTATTDTTITTKKVVLISQLQVKNVTSDKPLSYRGLSLEELCKQLGHFNKSVRRDALMGTKQLLMSRPDLIENHLRTLVPAVARLISDCAYVVDKTNLGRSCEEVRLDMSSGEISSKINIMNIFLETNPFDFPVITSSASSMVSPLEVPESLLNLCENSLPLILYL
ncbi:hypothetical protein TELCIR_04114 [Teladorsagia circumcincta]|uniref:Uncharacterized protein n=1 Tax=Teladorsagia circumcincta TaxID=45464 RepID=A0A2G9UUH0_TELCI|nr:hypothetical protein TELCIR_04114 [Teladorsagia circumcincta]